MDESTPPLGDHMPFVDFDAAAHALLAWLQGRLGFALWAVTALEDGHHRVRVAIDERYDVAPGNHYAWLDAYCSQALAGAPPIAWDRRAVPAYADLPGPPDAPVLAFAAVLLCRSDGTVGGMLCAADPLPLLPEVADEAPLLALMGRVLSTLDAWWGAQGDAAGVRTAVTRGRDSTE